MLEAPDLDKLCEIFDPHRNGYIVIEDFIRISKEFLPEQKISEIVDLINQSNNSARIEYAVFKMCIQDCFQELGEKETKNELERHENDEEQFDDDIFKIDKNELNRHIASINSIKNKPKGFLARTKLISKIEFPDADELTEKASEEDEMYEKETGEEMREKDDEFKELLNQQQERLSDCEKKLAYLSYENDQLVNENNELSKKLNAEMLKNDTLTEKMEEIEESLSNYQRSCEILADEKKKMIEHVKHVEQTLEEGSKAFISKISKLENENHLMKSATSEIEIEMNQLRANYQVQEKTHLKQVEFQKLEMEKLAREQEMMVNDLKNELFQYEQKLELLNREFVEYKRSVESESRRDRSTTLVEKPSNQTMELEKELFQLKAENYTLSLRIEELNAERMLNSNSSHNSFDELQNDEEYSNLSTKQLLIKLKNEESKSKQMQEYLDYLLFEIMSKHPEILEKKNSKTSTKR